MEDSEAYGGRGVGIAHTNEVCHVPEGCYVARVVVAATTMPMGQHEHLQNPKTLAAALDST